MRRGVLWRLPTTVHTAPQVTYRFALNGVVGSTLQFLQHKRVDGSVVKGFEQLQELAEKAEASG